MKTFIALALIFTFFQAVFSGSPCQVAEGTSVLTIDPACQDRLLCNVECNNKVYKMSCPNVKNEKYSLGIQINPRYGLARHHSVACASNTVAMKQLSKHLKDTAFRLRGELSLALKFRVIRFSNEDRVKVQNYLTHFFPILEKTELTEFWRRQKRVCDQSKYGVPIKILMNRFYTNQWTDPSITEGIKAFNETYPVLQKYKHPFSGKKLIDHAIYKYRRGVPLLKDWHPQLDKSTMIVEALAYLANLRTLCPCTDLLKLIQTGVAPDGKGFPELKLPEERINSLIGFVGQACETKYTSKGCKSVGPNTLEYDSLSDEENIQETW